MPLEPLRAREVLLLEDGFRFLCSEECRGLFLQGERHHDAARESRRAAAPGAPRPPGTRTPTARKRVVVSTPEASAAHRALSEPAQPPPWLGLAAAGAGIVLGALAKSPIVAVLAALAVIGASTAALVSGWSARREVGWLGWALAPAGACVAAAGALVARSPGNDARLWLVGAAVAAGAVVVRSWLDVRARQPVAAVTAYLLARMPSSVRVPIKGADWALATGSEDVAPARVRTGQDVLLREGDVAGVDGVVQAGEAFALLHPSARTPVRRMAGEGILAGARVVEGEVRMLATRVGDERALVRPAAFGDPRSHRSAPLTVVAARLTRWGGLLALAGAAGGLLLSATDTGLAGQLSIAAAVLLAVPLVAIRRASEAPYVAAAATAAERGITFSSAHTMDKAGRIAVAALCTHGTITEGEPEVVEVHAVVHARQELSEALGEGTDARRSLHDAPESHALVALVAGAEMAAEGHPIARAVLRFAEAQRIAPESVRRASFLPGRGVTAVSPAGQELVIGNRALLLAEGVSVAVADADAARAEERGHTVAFVGLEGRVRAVVSLRDEERLGARAAVQRLIDLAIEVVLVSGDHRGTVEAIARNLDIGHVKAELLPDERGAEVRRLRETGGVVAVVGRAGHDDPALAAADVQVVLGAAGAAEGERAISLTSEDVRDAAAALWLARAARRAAWRGTIGAALGGALLVALAALGVAAPAVVALCALGIDAYALPGGARLLRRIELRLPVRG